jgi:hypothetical protein
MPLHPASFPWVLLDGEDTLVMIHDGPVVLNDLSSSLSFPFFLFSFFLFFLSRRFFYRHRPSEKAIRRTSEGVTILKPLKGVDKALEANLDSFFHIDYPKFEILFSVDSEADPAGAVVQNLIKKYPNVDARLVICGFSSFVPFPENTFSLFDHFFLACQPDCSLGGHGTSWIMLGTSPSWISFSAILG